MKYVEALRHAMELAIARIDPVECSEISSVKITFGNLTCETEITVTITDTPDGFMFHEQEKVSEYIDIYGDLTDLEEI